MRRSPTRGRVGEFGERGGDAGEVRPLKLKCCCNEGDRGDGAALGETGVADEADSLSRNSTHIFEKDCNTVSVMRLVIVLATAGSNVLRFRLLYRMV